MQNEIHAGKYRRSRRRNIRRKYCRVPPDHPDLCHQCNVLHCWKPILPKYQTNFIGHFLQKMAQGILFLDTRRKTYSIMKKKTFLFSILDHKEGDSFIIVSKDKYGGVALSSYILINSRPASELSLLPLTNVTSLQ